jgi:hypothetical protein
MPIRDQDDSEEPQADAGLLEFIDRRRGYQARERRQRVLVAAIATLAVIAVALAFSNVILLRRLAGRPESGPAAAVSTAPSVASAPTGRVSTAPPAASAPAASVASPPGMTVTSARPPATVPPSAPPANMGMVVESTTPAVPTLPEPKGRVADDNDSARRTARWLVQTHGRLEAENRAAKVAEFYSGEQGAFWRRVLLNMRQEPER